MFINSGAALARHLFGRPGRHGIMIWTTMVVSAMATIESRRVPLESARLGVTLSHEHVLAFLGEENKHYPWRFDWDETLRDRVRELSDAKAGGIDTMIDLSTPDLGRDVEFMRKVAE